MNISKMTYRTTHSGDNIGYLIEDSGCRFFLPALNASSCYDEAFDQVVVESGIHLKEEATKCLSNIALFEGLNTLDEAVSLEIECKLIEEKRRESDYIYEDFSDAQL